MNDRILLRFTVLPHTTESLVDLESFYGREDPLQIPSHSSNPRISRRLEVTTHATYKISSRIRFMLHTSGSFSDLQSRYTRKDQV